MGIKESWLNIRTKRLMKRLDLDEKGFAEFLLKVFEDPEVKKAMEQKDRTFRHFLLTKRITELRGTDLNPYE